jgi:hypothetical protein
MGNSTSGPQNMLYCFPRFQSISVNSMSNFMHLAKNLKRINSFLIIILLRCFLNVSQATGKQFVCLSTTKITSTGRQVAFSIPENIYDNLNWTKFRPYWIIFQWRRKTMPCQILPTWLQWHDIKHAETSLLCQQIMWRYSCIINRCTNYV